MEGDKEIGVVVLVSLILAGAGIGYMGQFSDIFGNKLALSPWESGGGIQFSPSENLAVICQDGKFAGCEVLEHDFVCWLNARGVVKDGSFAIHDSTLCGHVDCVC